MEKAVVASAGTVALRLYRVLLVITRENRGKASRYQDVHSAESANARPCPIKEVSVALTHPVEGKFRLGQVQPAVIQPCRHSKPIKISVTFCVCTITLKCAVCVCNVCVISDPHLVLVSRLVFIAFLQRHQWGQNHPHQPTDQEPAQLLCGPSG